MKFEAPSGWLVAAGVVGAIGYFLGYFILAADNPDPVKNEILRIGLPMALIAVLAIFYVVDTIGKGMEIEWQKEWDKKDLNSQIDHWVNATKKTKKKARTKRIK